MPIYHKSQFINVQTFKIMHLKIVKTLKNSWGSYTATGSEITEKGKTSLYYL